MLPALFRKQNISLTLCGSGSFVFTLIFLVWTGSSFAQVESVIDSSPTTHPPSHAHAMHGVGSVPAQNNWDFLTNYGRYMPRTHCLLTEAGTPDWPWIIGLVVLNLGVLVGYLRIFMFWRRSYRQEKKEDRNQKMMDLAYIFLWCGVCGYAMSLVIFVWPAYRLLALCLAVLVFFTWRFAWKIDDLGVSLSAKRLQRQLREALDKNRSREDEALANKARRAVRKDVRLTYSSSILAVIASAVAIVVGLTLSHTWFAHTEGFIRDLIFGSTAALTTGFFVWFLTTRPLKTRIAQRVRELHAAMQEIQDNNRTLHRLSMVAARTDNAVLISDATGHIEWVNEGFTRITGYELDDIRGRRPGALLQGPDTDPQVVQFMSDQLKSGQGFQAEVLNYAKDGRPYWLALDVQPVRDDDGRITNFIAIETEITERKEMEQRLRESTERLRIGLDAAGGGEWDWDIQSGEVHYSDRWLKLFGYTEDQAKPDIEFWKSHVHPDDMPSVQAQIEDHFNGKTHDYQSEYRLLTGQGKYVWTLACGRILSRDEQGRPLRMQGINFDTDERKRAEESLQDSEQRFRGAFEQAAVGIAHVAPDGSWLRVNQKLCEIVGYSNEELMGLTFQDITHPDDLDDDLKQVEQLVVGDIDTYAMEKRYIRKDDSIVWVNLSVSLVRNHLGDPQYFISIIEDITDRKRTALELRKAKDEAEEASRAKSEFLATMSHELRTPLNGVIGMTELLRDTDLDGRQERFVDACHASGTSLLTLINDILDLSKIEAGRLELDDRPFLIQQCIDDTISMMAHRAHAEGLEINYAVDPLIRQEVLGDGVRLRQILVNLIGNAIKFTEKGQVLLRAVLDEQTDHDLTVRFSVTDTGMGIPKEKLDRLFKSFSQADSTTARRFGGTGLGLSICKSLAEAMGGQIGVESEEGQGSTFWFTARFARSGDIDAISEWIPDDLRGLRVLIVDNNATSADILQTTFESWDAQVESVTTDHPLWDRMDSSSCDENYDLVVLDVPVSGGISEAIANRLIVSDEPLADHLLVLSPVNAEAVLDSDRATIAYRYVRKPPSPSELLDALTDLFDPATEKMTGDIDVDGSEATSIHSLLPDGQGINGRVLLVEDHPTNQMYVRELLRRCGLTVEVASNGQEAVDMVRDATSADERLNLVFMDCQMPVMDGFDATAAIRKLEAENQRPSGDRESTKLPIVALTANAIKGDRERCLEAGMDDYLSKPIEAAALIEMVKKHLGTSQQETQSSALSLEAKTAVECDDPPLDADAALERCMGDAEFLAATLGSFAQETPAYVLELTRTLEQGDAESVTRAAHTIKGAAGMITAEALRGVAAEIEALGHDDRLDEAAGQLDRLRHEAERCLEHVQRILKGITSGT